ncbi:uncharacterized protein LOC129592466 [Paramacrobiotus metropolitanus]|uniref:uncharacterized protein LOC129592466 n=1 Tax=Paramacrobiotus metropolitanus TaxID=2943436 RepID=UPI002445C95B|nr:uncharacterized protein LOC129592466 [Paramacrobiotus metropolitanus]XP_055344496.1 uncharacterized protein LOC129592466 [Paramacrobiotus metropolitanus]
MSPFIMLLTSLFMLAGCSYGQVPVPNPVVSDHHQHLFGLQGFDHFPPAAEQMLHTLPAPHQELLPPPALHPELHNGNPSDVKLNIAHTEPRPQPEIPPALDSPGTHDPFRQREAALQPFPSEIPHVLQLQPQSPPVQQYHYAPPESSSVNTFTPIATIKLQHLVPAQFFSQMPIRTQTYFPPAHSQIGQAHPAGIQQQTLPQKTRFNAADARNIVDPHKAATTPHYRILGVPSAGFLEVSYNGSAPQYSGAIIDILDKLSVMLNFSYEFSIQPDQQYGKRLPDGSWNGLIRSLVYNKMDIAAADLSVTPDRETVVDFTTPFSHYSMGILAHKNFSSYGEGNISYIIRDTADATFLNKSQVAKYRDIWNNIANNFPHSYMETDQEAIEKLSTGPYAYIMESFGLSKAVESSNGQLQELGKFCPAGFLAFAVPSGSPLRERLSLGLARLMESGDLQFILYQHFSMYFQQQFKDMQASM